MKNGGLEIPIARGKRLSILLTKHTLNVISQPGVTVHSFTLTRNILSLCIAHDVPIVECTSTIGVDRNLRNLTVGNEQEDTSVRPLRDCAYSQYYDAHSRILQTGRC